MPTVLRAATTADSNSVAIRPSCMAAASILAALRACHGNGIELGQAYCCFSMHIDQVSSMRLIPDLVHSQPQRGDAAELPPLH